MEGRRGKACTGNAIVRKRVGNTIVLMVAASALCTSFVAGCGSSAGRQNSNGGNGAAVSATGRATLTIVWPAPATRLIPDAAMSITVSVLRGQTVVAKQTVARPPGTASSTLDFPALPVGSLTVTAAAYPVADGSGVALASGTTPLDITSGQNTTFGITMTSTIASIVVTPAPLNLLPNYSPVTLTATARDAAGSVVLLSPARLHWVSLNTSVALVDSSGISVTVSPGAGAVPGNSATITVTDTESKVLGAADIFIIPPATSAAAHYTITDIGVLPGPGAIGARGINNRGQVVGDFLGSSFSAKIAGPFLWTAANGPQDLSTLTGRSVSSADHINDNGTVFGTLNNYQAAYRWRSGQGLVNLGVPPPPGNGYFFVNGVNRRDQAICGAFTLNTDGTTSNFHVYLSSPGTTLQDLGSFGAGDLNDNGTMVGVISVGGGVSHAALWRNGSIQDIGITAGDTQVGSTFMNNAEQVSGDVTPTASIFDGRHPFFWTAGTGMQSLPVPPGCNFAIVQKMNNGGLTVGSCQFSDVNTPDVAAIWSGGQCIDLNSRLPAGTGWRLTDANGINDYGQIVGRGTLNGVDHTFLLTPLP